MTGGTIINTSVNDFLNDQSYDSNPSELVRENCDNCESVQQSIVSDPTLKCSQ